MEETITKSARLAKLHESQSRSKSKPGTPLSEKNRIVYIEDLIASGFARSRRTIWRRIKDGELPQPFLYGGRAAWREATIAKHMNSLQPV